MPGWSSFRIGFFVFVYLIDSGHASRKEILSFRYKKKDSSNLSNKMMRKKTMNIVLDTHWSIFLIWRYFWQINSKLLTRFKVSWLINLRLIKSSMQSQKMSSRCLRDLECLYHLFNASIKSLIEHYLHFAHTIVVN